LGDAEASEYDFDYFFCTICKAWFKLSKTSGNALKHGRIKHSDHYFDTDSHHQSENKNDVVVNNTLQDVVSLFLRHDLSFRLAESQMFRRMTGTNFTRQAVSEEVKRMKVKYDTEIIDELKHMPYIVLTCDEWTDCAMNGYFGIRAIGLAPEKYGTSVCTKYVCFSLAHWSMTSESGTAQGIKDMIGAVMKRFFPQGNSKIEWIVTDTTRVMPKAVSLLQRQWMPCWGHVLNLMLNDILKRISSTLEPILDLVRLTACSKKWASFVKEGKYATLPTYTPTRWYSMYRLIKNALKLKPDITKFLAKLTEDDRNVHPIPDSAWNCAEKIRPVLKTFKYWVGLLESNRLGTLAHVLEAIKMIRMSISSLFGKGNMLIEEIPENLTLGPFLQAVKQGWQDAEKRFTERVDDRIKDALLLAIMLNPAVVPSTILSREDCERAETILQTRFDSLRRTEDDRPARSNPKKRPSAFTRDLLIDVKTDEWSEFQRVQRGFDILNFNVSDWWRSNKDRFPTLFQLVQQHLIIPATSATSERQFSKAKRMKTKKRWSLKGTSLGAMVVVAENRDLIEERIAQRLYQREASVALHQEENTTSNKHSGYRIVSDSVDLDLDFSSDFQSDNE
jgi:hypothetical protein